MSGSVVFLVIVGREAGLRIDTLGMIVAARSGQQVWGQDLPSVSMRVSGCMGISGAVVPETWIAGWWCGPLASSRCY